jgi:hypothetical protein
LDWTFSSRCNSRSRGIHVGWDNFLTTLPHPAGLTPFFAGNWSVYAENPDTQHVYNTLTGAGTAILTFRVVSIRKHNHFG